MWLLIEVKMGERCMTSVPISLHEEGERGVASLSVRPNEEGEEVMAPVLIRKKTVIPKEA